jgi:hypothetical protein
MVSILYVVASVLLILAVIAASPFTKTYFLVFATGAFLLARFIRIEKRLDKIEGIQRSSRLKRVATWAWSNRDPFIAVGYLLLMVGVVWWSWGSIAESLSAISPKHPHPWLQAVLTSNRAVTVILVWFPLATFLAFLLLGLIAFYVISTAVLLGFLPGAGSHKRAVGPRVFARWEKLVTWAGALFAAWLLFVMAYAKEETDALFALIPFSDQQLSGAQLGLWSVGCHWGSSRRSFSAEGKEGD